MPQVIGVTHVLMNGGDYIKMFLVFLRLAAASSIGVSYKCNKCFNECNKVLVKNMFLQKRHHTDSALVDIGVGITVHYDMQERRVLANKNDFQHCSGGT